jgi:hypothetical protein
MASGTQVPYIVRIDVDADATAGLDYELIHPGIIADAWFVTTTGAAFTITLQRQAQGAGAFAAVSSALSAAAADDVARTVDIIAAQASCAAGDVLRALASAGGGAVRGYLYVTIVQAPQQ